MFREILYHFNISTFSDMTGKMATEFKVLICLARKKIIKRLNPRYKYGYEEDYLLA